MTVWDVRAKKENLTLNNSGRKAVSAIAWDPEQVGWRPSKKRDTVTVCSANTKSVDQTYHRGAG